MRAIVFTEYGAPDVLHLQDVEKPVPKDNEILVKVRATSVGYGDLLARRLNEVTMREFNMPSLFLLMAKFYFGFRRPRVHVLGSEFAGEIEAVGKSVKSFKAKDQVFGYLGQNMGAYAEYVCVPETGTVDFKPANMTYEEAAVIPMGSIMAIHLLREMHIQKGQNVLIIGASGGIGSAAVQIAKYYGAHVTGVCGAARFDFVKALGADEVLDYTKDDYQRNAARYDLIVDILGRGSFSQARNALKPNGKYLFVSFKIRQLIQAKRGKTADGKHAICGLAPGSKADLDAVRELIVAGKMKSIIDKSFPMEQAAEAHRYAESGQRKGPVAITIA
ncbi:NAD(P)-dependent alcohol dehydrogenase [candidate division KSB1 bacterium]|nr:MAG: NAD(P)-dependent alcohol dehydrogenase [candidate division KSB1 bacterium]